MGTTLTGTTPQDTYDSLIKVTDNGPLSGTLKKLTDGLGNDSSLSLSTTAASFSGSLTISGDTVGSKFYTAGSVVPTAAVSVFLNANYGGPAFNNSSFVTGNGATGVMIGGDTASYTYGWIQGVQTDNGTSKNLSLQPIGGSVGIGTSSPASKFHVAGADAWMTLQRTSGTTNILDFTDSAAARLGYVGFISSSLTINAKAGSDIIFAPNNDERGRFTSNGLTFNGDTAAANALDDYEEGTFTPTMLGATFTLTTASGYYTKIGRQVSIWVECEGTYSSPTGAFRVASLPFTQAGGRAEGIFSAVAGISFGGYCSAETISTTMYLESHASGTGTNRTDMDSTFFNAAGFRFMVSQTYFV